MSGHPPFGKHTPRLRLGTFGKEARAAWAPAPSRMVPLHQVTLWKGKQWGGVGWREDTSSLAKRHGGLSFSLSGLTSWTLHTLMYKYLPLAKVQAALCGCQTQQKTNIQGKVFTAVVAKGATASRRAHLIGQACLRCYPKAPGPRPLGCSHPFGDDCIL